MRNEHPHTVKERHIDSPLLALNLDQQARSLKTEPQWIAGTRNGIALAKYPHMRVVLVALKKGAALRDQKADGPMMLYLLNGRLAVTANGQRVDVRRKSLFTLRKTVPRDVRALADSTILMTMMRQ